MSLGTFLAGMLAGAVVAWPMSKAIERFRRARYDWITAWRGRKTLVEMMWNRGWTAAKWAATGGLIVVVAVYAWYRSNA